MGIWTPQHGSMASVFLLAFLKSKLDKLDKVPSNTHTHTKKEEERGRTHTHTDQKLDASKLYEFSLSVLGTELVHEI